MKIDIFYENELLYENLDVETSQEILFEIIQDLHDENLDIDKLQIIHRD